MPYRQNIQTITQNNPDMPRATRRRLAALGDFAVAEGVDASMYETPEQMIEDLEERLQNQAQNRPASRRPVPFHSQAYSMIPTSSIGGPIAAIVHGQQGNHLQGMANDAMSAIQNENDSRVAQAREMRRMQHEKEMEQMRINALIMRLGQQAPMDTAKARFEGGAIY